MVTKPSPGSPVAPVEFRDSHFLIEKSAENESVKTRIRLLNEEDSVKELARILGGDKITSSIMESAREMKEMAKSEI